MFYKIATVSIIALVGLFTVSADQEPKGVPSPVALPKVLPVHIDSVYTLPEITIYGEILSKDSSKVEGESNP